MVPLKRGEEKKKDDAFIEPNAKFYIKKSGNTGHWTKIQVSVLDSKNSFFFSP